MPSCGISPVLVTFLTIKSREQRKPSFISLHNWRQSLATYRPLRYSPQKTVQRNATNHEDYVTAEPCLQITANECLAWGLSHGCASMRWLSASSRVSLSSVHEENHGFSYAKLWFQFQFDFRKNRDFSVKNHYSTSHFTIPIYILYVFVANTQNNAQKKQSPYPSTE